MNPLDLLKAELLNQNEMIDRTIALLQQLQEVL